MKLTFTILNFILAGICIYQESTNENPVKEHFYLPIFLIINGILLLT